MYGPTLISEYGQIGPLFSDERQQPLRLKGALNEAVEKLHDKYPLEQPDDYYELISDSAAAGFDYLLICNAQLLRKPFPPGSTMISKTPHFALLRADR